MTQLTTERLTLRELVAEDAGFVLDLLNQPSFIDNIGDRGVRSLDEARAYIEEGPRAGYASVGHHLWRVGLKANDTPIGLCGLIKRETLEHVDVGYAFLPAYWRRGYAYEAAAACMAHGREVLGLATIVAIVKPGNAGSVAVLEKLGLGYERTVELPSGTSDLYTPR